MNTHCVSLLAKRQLVNNIFEFTFRIHIADEFTFTPGQYVWLVLNNLIQTDQRGNRRAFSIIAYNKETKSITFIFKSSDSAYKRAIHNLPIGARAEIVGPFGSAYLIDENTSPHIVLVAGGIGIAPFISIIGAKNLYPKHQFTLIYSNTSIESGVYLKQLQDICKQAKINLISHTGYIDDSVFPGTINYQQSEFFVSGSIDFVNVVYKILLRKQVNIKQMRFEQFYPNSPFNLTEDYFKQKYGDTNILIQALHDADNHVIITDANGIILFANRKAQKTTGYSFEEMRGNTPRLWGGMMSADFYKELWKRKRQPEGFIGELTNRRKDGTVYNVIAHISPIFTKDKTITGFIGTEEDITHKIKHLNQLEHQNRLVGIYKNKFNALVNNIDEGLIVLDPERTIIMINERAIEIIGNESKDYTNKKVIDICRFMIENENYCINTLGVCHLINSDSRFHKIEKHLFIRRADGTKLPVSLKVSTHTGVSGNFLGLLLLFKEL